MIFELISQASVYSQKKMPNIKNILCGDNREYNIEKFQRQFMNLIKN